MTETEIGEGTETENAVEVNTVEDETAGHEVLGLMNAMAEVVSIMSRRFYSRTAQPT